MCSGALSTLVDAVPWVVIDRGLAFRRYTVWLGPRRSDRFARRGGVVKPPRRVGVGVDQ